MHVGPGDPLFRGPPAGVYPGADPAGSFPGGPGYGSEPGFPPGGLPPGAHWDPIMPPGMQVGGIAFWQYSLTDGGFVRIYPASMH